jgi:hypothetical protein
VNVPNNQLSDDEELARIYESLGRQDMALSVHGGRLCHRVSFLLEHDDRLELAKPCLKGFYQLIGNESWEWETWHLPFRAQAGTLWNIRANLFFTSSLVVVQPAP